MKRSERQASIMSALFMRRQEAIANLAEEFHVSTRTIRSDIHELMEKFPIETVRGRYGGGVKLADDYYPYQRRLNRKQYQLLLELRKNLHGTDLIIMNSILSQFAPF